MLRWLKKKCSKRNTKKDTVKSNRAEMSCHEGIDFHIYEEVPPTGSPKIELAYSIVSLVDKMDADQEMRMARQHRKTLSSLSEIICSLCEKPLPGVMNVPLNVTCRCSGLSSFRSSDCSSSDKFSWLDYDCDEEHDLRRRHPDLDVIQTRVEPMPRSRQPIYIANFPGEEIERRFYSDDSGGYFDTDYSGNITDSSLDDSVVNNLDSLDLADDSMNSFRLSQTPKMGCRVIRRTRSANDSLGIIRVSIASGFLTPAKISQPVPVCGIHRSTDKSTLLRASLKRKAVLPEEKGGRYASIRRGLQCYGMKEEDMGYEPASTDDEDVCINVADILRSKISKGKKCLMDQFSVLESNESNLNDLDKNDHEFFV